MQLTGFYYHKFLLSKYSTLLFALVTMIITFPLMEHLFFGKALFAIFYLFILIGMFYSLKGTRHTLAFMIVGFFTLGVNIAEIQFKNLEIISLALSILFYIYAIILFCKDIYTSKKITKDILLGSICVYLLIGISFALMFMILQSIDLDTVAYQSNHMPIYKASDFYYFSFITLATVGFGDIVVQTSFAKSIVMIEGITGTFYIAIFVARLVTLFNR